MISIREKLAEIKQKVGTKNLCLLLLAGGLFLLSFASGMFSTTKDEEPGQAGQTAPASGTGAAKPEQTQAELWEEQLKQVLSGVKGVGKIQVMITLSDGGEKIVLKDAKNSTESLNEADGSGGTRVSIASEKEEETVYEADSSPFVTQEFTASVAGVLIVCEGGGNADVVIGIVSAVEALFGVPAHRVVVLEMK